MAIDTSPTELRTDPEPKNAHARKNGHARKNARDPKTAAEPRTARARVQLRAEQRVAAPPEDVFPLLCPVREHAWIPGWSCELVYTASGVAEEGCVFQTDRAADGGVDTWVVSRYEAPRRIAFVRVNPLRTILYDIQLEPVGEHSTRLVWQQTLTALSDAGDAHVAAVSAADFAATITRLEGLLNAHLVESVAAVATG
jgi:hypothetical protein